MSKETNTLPVISENVLLEIENHLEEIKCLAFAMIAALQEKHFRADDDDMEGREIKPTELMFVNYKPLLKVFASSISDAFFVAENYLENLHELPEQNNSKPAGKEDENE